MDYLAAGTLTLLLLVAVPFIAILRWEYGLALTLASLSLINRLKTTYFVDFGYAIVTAETAFVLLLLIVWHIRVGTRPERFDPYLMGPVFWLLVSGVASLFCSMDIRISLRLLIAGVIEPIVLFYLIINNLKGIHQVKIVVYALIVSATFATFYGFWQILLTISATGNPFDYRIVSTYYSPAIFGEILLLSFPLVVVTRISLQKPKLAVGLLLDILLGCMIVALLMTITRSAWLGLIASLSVLMFNREFRSYFYGLIPMLIPIVLIVVVIQPEAISELFTRRSWSLSDFGNRTTSIGERIFAWQTACVMIMDNPIGIGLGMFRQIWPIYQPMSAGLDAAHNLLLDIGVQMGVIALLSFIWIVIDSVRTGMRLIRASTDPYIARLGLGILSCLAGYFAHALSGGAEFAHNVRNVIDPLGSPISTGMIVFWSLLGCLYILRESEKNRSQPVLLRDGRTEGHVREKGVVIQCLPRND